MLAVKTAWQEANEAFHRLRSMNKRQFAHQVLNLALIVCSAIMMWKLLCDATGSESPIVVVLSGSMEPAIYRGDILFLWLGSAPFSVGEIVVFKVKGKDVPIVHRIIEVHQRSSGDAEVLTKGDANKPDDRGLYTPGQLWLNSTDILGRAKGYLPYLGWFTIGITEYPIIKYVLVGLMALWALITKE